MTIIGAENLLRFKSDKAAARSLSAWREICEKATWRQFSDVRCQFPNADSVGDCVVFNIRHNRYRVIAKVAYSLGIVTIRSVLTHAEYDRGGWKNGCGR
ncbi:MAG TPA: type II toxin-antitoxin system HigB family toxin [Bryobacteraceae bacterium]|nr:type II toxin-antitoxin system HigB family toxin [Bryobacteraceae bacterium]